jgi:hypothetical protein
MNDKQEIRNSIAQEIRDSIASSTQQWINSISSQKLAQNNSENYVSQNYQQPTTSTFSEKPTFNDEVEKVTGSNADIKLELPPAPENNNLYVLTIRGGVLAWTATEDCS